MCLTTCQQTGPHRTCRIEGRIELQRRPEPARGREGAVDGEGREAWTEKLEFRLNIFQWPLLDHRTRSRTEMKRGTTRTTHTHARASRDTPGPPRTTAVPVVRPRQPLDTALPQMCGITHGDITCLGPSRHDAAWTAAGQRLDSGRTAATRSEDKTTAAMSEPSLPGQGDGERIVQEITLKNNLLRASRPRRHQHTHRPQGRRAAAAG